MSDLLYTTTLGDGVNSAFVVHHNLHTRHPQIQVYAKDLTLLSDLTTMVADEDTVLIETGTFFEMSEHWMLFGRWPIPRLWRKIAVVPGSIPEPDSLRVTVLA